MCNLCKKINILPCSSSLGETSGSEVSCDTVIYVRPNGIAFSDRELTDNEGPPVSIPIRIQSPPTKVLLSKIPETRTNSHFPSSTHDSSDMRRCKKQNADTKKKCSYKLPTGESDNNIQLASGKTDSKQSLEHRHSSMNQNKLSRADGNENQHVRRLGTRSKVVKTNNESKATFVDKPSKLKQPGSVNTRGKGIITAPPRSTRDPRPGFNLQCVNRIAEPSGKLQTDAGYDVRWQSSMPQQRSFSAEDRRVSEQSLKNTKEVFTNKLARIVHGADRQNVENHQLCFIPHHSQVETDLKSVIRDGREEPDGCDGSSSSVKDHHPKKSFVTDNVFAPTELIPPIIQKETIQIEKESTELNRCLKELEGVLQTVNKPSDANDFSRPASMFVNVNEEEWKRESDDLDDSVKDDTSEADGNVVDVNFYCLSFTTKNPLVPLSKNTFVRQVSNRKRQSLEEQNNGAKFKENAVTKRKNESEDKAVWNERAEQSDGDFDFQLEDANQRNEIPGNDCMELKRSNTFVVDSDHEKRKSTERDMENNSLKCEGNDVDTSYRGGNPVEKVSPNESNLISHHSTLSSPSQVLLYDSSSLEINYIKPKSLSFTRKSATKCSNIEKPTTVNMTARSESKSPEKRRGLATPGFVRNGYNSDLCDTRDRRGSDTTVVMGTKSPGKNSTQLSLVKTEGAKSTLELVIAGTERDDQGYAEPTVSKKSLRGAKSKQLSEGKGKKNTPKHESTNENIKLKSTNSCKLKWTGLKRFVGNKSEDREKQHGDSNSPRKHRPGRKHGDNEHAAKSANASFVFKLLSPKLKREQKSPFSTSKSTEFRYRSPNTINQMRHDIVRTNIPMHSGTTSLSTILQR